MSQVMVGRQPIFDGKLDVYGYELLFRGAGGRKDADVMTADVLVRAGLDIGLENLVGQRFAFVNAPRAFLVGTKEVPLPPEQTVIEVLEDVAHDEDLLDGCRRLVQAGYPLALDDYVWSDGDEQLLELASIVKLDVLALTSDQLADHVASCRRFGVRLLAEKVETPDQMQMCRELGFDLFQGYLLSKPEVVERTGLDPNRVTCLQLINKLCDPDVSAGEIERIVEGDAGLSYRFLRAAGAGAGRGLRRPVSSIREGVVLLGQRRLRSWVILMLLADAHQGSAEQIAIAMTRARMTELMAAAAAPHLRDSAFTAGLVSALDLLLGTPLPDVIEQLSITDDLASALLDHTGPLGSILNDVLSWEVAGQSGNELEISCGLSPEMVEKTYVDALAWGNEVCAVLEHS
ncbi:MAG TPA: EAL domain-containing protein [Acidimicrobiales bacterium]|nr:EAL domain-containing protein [Acidimicrobiales bacterium]